MGVCTCAQGGQRRWLPLELDLQTVVSLIGRLVVRLGFSGEDVLLVTEPFLQPQHCFLVELSLSDLLGRDSDSLTLFLTPFQLFILKQELSKFSWLTLSLSPDQP